MAIVHDVAAYIIEQCGAMTAMKLQKLAYYAQAWSLVWDEQPLFPEPIQAWANGPVVRELFNQHRGQYTVASWPAGDSGALTQVQRDTVDQVVRSYGDLSARQLSHLTHSEAPWREARGGLPDTARSEAEIPLDSLLEFYGALDASDEATDVDDLDWEEWLATMEGNPFDEEG